MQIGMFDGTEIPISKIGKIVCVNKQKLKKCIRCGEYVEETDNNGYCDICHEDMFGKR